MVDPDDIAACKQYREKIVSSIKTSLNSTAVPRRMVRCSYCTRERVQDGEGDWGGHWLTKSCDVEPTLVIFFNKLDDKNQSTFDRVMKVHQLRFFYHPCCHLHIEDEKKKFAKKADKFSDFDIVCLKSSKEYTCDLTTSPTESLTEKLLPTSS